MSLTATATTASSADTGQERVEHEQGLRVSETRTSIKLAATVGAAVNLRVLLCSSVSHISLSPRPASGCSILIEHGTVRRCEALNLVGLSCPFLSPWTARPVLTAGSLSPQGTSSAEEGQGTQI